jgi:hypothetical protein
MNLKKYLTKHTIIRLCLMLALVSAAVVFDVVHSAERKTTGSTRRIPIRDDSDGNKLFFCNQVPTFNLKTSVNLYSVRLRFLCTQDKFILKYYNLRTFQLMKAETVHSFVPAVSMFHSLPFNRVLYESPDDIPPLS